MLKKIKESYDLVIDLTKFMISRKKFWLAPLIFVLILIGTLFIILESSVIAPFIYAIF